MSERPSASRIPLFFSVHLEPDPDLDVGQHGPVEWTGFGALQRHLRELATALTDATESALRIGWYLRMDRQVEMLCGSPDYTARIFAERLEPALDEIEHYTGLHVHASRWDGRRQRWTIDTCNEDVWFEELNVGLDAYTAARGEAPRRFNFTRSLTNDAIRSRLMSAGVRIDLSPEPSPRKHKTAANWAPHVEHRGSGVPLWMIPANAGLPHSGSTMQRWARRARYGRHARWHLHPYREQSPTQFWDDIARSCAEAPFPYVVLALRTSAAGSWTDHRQRAVLDALIQHPFARHLAFADPLDLVQTFEALATAR